MTEIGLFSTNLSNTAPSMGGLLDDKIAEGLSYTISSHLYTTGLGARTLLRQCDRNLVQVDRVVEDQLMERLFPESRLCRSMSHRLGVWPRAVEPGEVAGPKEIREADFGHA